MNPFRTSQSSCAPTKQKGKFGATSKGLWPENEGERWREGGGVRGQAAKREKDGEQGTMIGVNRQLATNEPVEFEK